MQTVTLMQVGKSFAATIPAPIRRELGWLKGDTLAIAIHKNNVVLRSIENRAIRTRRTTSNRGANELTKVTAHLRTPRS